MDSLELLQSFTAIPAPPGQEYRLCHELMKHVKELGLTCDLDAKGNVIVPLGDEPPRIVITAHMDEIALLVRQVLPDGSLTVTNLGGLYPWKLGEGPVEILVPKGLLTGILGFGSIHTNDPASRAQQAREKPLDWPSARVFTGLSADELNSKGVIPGTRVVVARSRRNLVRIGDHVAGYFLDDRADLVSWCIALERLKGISGVTFAATASEEVGGEGAQFIFNAIRPDICIALELSPIVPDAPSQLSSAPSIWANDGYAAPAPVDLHIVGYVAGEAGIPIQYQAFSRGGSDASCSASRGLCARHFTLGLPMENSHGFEIMHKDAMDRLADLTVALVTHLAEDGKGETLGPDA